MKARVVFLPYITKKLRHKSLGFTIDGDSKENTQTEGQKRIKCKAGEVYLVYHCLPHIPTAAERGRKEHAFLPLVEGSIGVIYPYAESAVAWAGAVLVATCTGLLVKKARTMATTRRAADK